LTTFSADHRSCQAPRRMRLGGATGVPPVRRSGHHDRSQPDPPPPMLAQQGFRVRLLPTLTPTRSARWGKVSHTACGGVAHGHHPPNSPKRTAAAGPAISLCFATGDGGACGSSLAIRTAHCWRDLDHAIPIPTSTGVRPRSRFAPSNTPSRFERPRRSQRARLTPVTLAASARRTSNTLPLRDHERPSRHQRRQNVERPRTASFGRVYDAAVAPASP